MNLTITLADAYRREQFTLGRELAPEHTLAVPVADLSVEDRAHLARINPALGDTALRVGPQRWPAPLLPATPADWATLLAAHKEALAAHEATERERRIADLDREIAHLRDRAAHPDAGRPAPGFSPRAGDADLPNYEGVVVAAREALAAHEEAARRRAEVARAEDEARARAKAERDASRATWIAAHGSAFLRRAVGAGYDCQRRYFEERAALEYPGYTPDFDDAIRYTTRSCPSEAALAEALRVGGRVVWLNEALPAEFDDYPDDRPYNGEAVVVELLGHDLIRSI